MFFLLPLLGGAVSALAKNSAANRREDIAQTNYGIDVTNAQLDYGRQKTQLRLDNIGTRINLDASRTSMKLALADAQARERNAERLRLFAAARTKESRQGIRRQMRSFEEFQSGQAAAVGKSGVTMGGSAIEVLLESAEQFKMQIQDMHTQASFERNNTLEDAQIEEIGADRDRAGARASFGYAKRGARLSRAASRLGRTSARTAFQSALLEAEMDRLSQNDTARGQRLSAAGQALGTVGNFLQMRYQYNQNAPASSGDIPSASAYPVGQRSIFR
jgi:hypothetical protein